MYSIMNEAPSDHEMDIRRYNKIELNYHINDYTLDEACELVDISRREYHNICKRLGTISTAKKVVKMSDDGKSFYYEPKKNNINV